MPTIKEQIAEKELLDIYHNKSYGNRKQRRQLARELIKGKIKLERKVKIQNPLAKKEKRDD